MADRPGIMLYFADWNGILDLEDDAVLGRFVRAALIYGQSGIDTAFEGMEKAVWEPLKAKIDRDGERYQRQQRAGEYAVYCREEKRAGRNPLTRIEWERYHSLSIDNEFIHTHTQTQSHTHSQTQSQGDQRGERTAAIPVQDFSTEFSTNEPDFEGKRNTAIKKLEDHLAQKKRGDLKL